MPEKITEMRANYALDIENSKKDDWKEGTWLNFVRDRLVKMRAKRQPFADSWKEYDTLTSAVSFQDNEGVLHVNVPMEKTLKEIYMGRTNGKCTFDIVPDGQADVKELQPTKFAMTFYLDGNGKDTFWNELNLMKDDKSQYGSGILYTGIRSYKDSRYTLKAGVEITGDTDLLDESNFEEHENETWFFFPKRIHPQDFFIDDAAYGQPNVQYADDCIFKEKLTATEFNKRYSKNKAFKNQDQVTYWQDITPKNINDRSIDVRHVVVYHYFHRITKKYVIFCNEQTIIFNGRYLYDDGKLPFVNFQHYARKDRFWGEGIPERVFWIKTYRSEILQDILTGAAMSSGVNLLVGNDDQVGQDWTVGGRGLNLWRTTGGADKVQRVDTSPNLGYFSAVLNLLDKETVTTSGINPLAQIESSAPTLGQEELVEANRAVRNASVDENFNLGIDEALTMMLSRIKQFAPSLLSEKIENKKGQVIKYVFPKIRIEGFRVEKRKGVQEFIEDAGKFGYFELKPEVIKGIGVKVTTQSTNLALNVLERNKINEYIANIGKIAAMAQWDPSGAMIAQVIKAVNIEQLMGWTDDTYGYDSGSLKANTQKDELKKQQVEKVAKINEMIAEAPQPVEAPAGAPTAQPGPLTPGSEAKAPKTGSSIQGGATERMNVQLPFSGAASGGVSFRG